MKLKLYFLVGLSIFLGEATYSQVMIKTTKVVDAPEGAELFSLNEGYPVFNFDPSEGWFEIRTKVLVEKSFVQDSVLQSGAVLFDENNQPVGEVLAPIRAKELRQAATRVHKKKYEVILVGWVYKFQIDRTTIPEEELFEFLNEDRKNSRSDILIPELKKFNFSEEEVGDLTAFVLFEKNRSFRPEPVFRMIFIFRGSSLIAVLTHQHEFLINNYKLKETQGEVNFYWLTKPNGQIRPGVEDLMWTYLPL